MANLNIGSGWLYLSDDSDYMLIYFKQCKWDFKMQPTIRHYAGAGTTYGGDTADRWRSPQFPVAAHIDRCIQRAYLYHKRH